MRSNSAIVILEPPTPSRPWPSASACSLRSASSSSICFSRVFCAASSSSTLERSCCTMRSLSLILVKSLSAASSCASTSLISLRIAAMAAGCAARALGTQRAGAHGQHAGPKCGKRVCWGEAERTTRSPNNTGEATAETKVVGNLCIPAQDAMCVRLTHRSFCPFLASQKFSPSLGGEEGFKADNHPVSGF